MTRPVEILLIRHGEAAASWDTALDPPLSPAGQQQAAALVSTLGGLTPRRLLSSPLQRAQDTAAPLAARWGRLPEIEDGIRELPSSVPMPQRREWLKTVMLKRWSEVDPALVAWRERVWQAVSGCREDSILFTHFMVINAVVGRALGDERLVVFEPDYCSVTRLSLTAGGCELLELGKSRATLVL